jgi:hypothetical protein
MYRRYRVSAFLELDLDMPELELLYDTFGCAHRMGYFNPLSKGLLKEQRFPTDLGIRDDLIQQARSLSW